ncbi:hypothetical protein CDAR_435701 [Caerostris darwini]|uniref:Prolamin-like domain-containing protein n=1 Tax=Caerostris darwini TaxID=1538125 RepID=A0AAV4P8D1_9ARAC|nr:hypothetical protein CDAR_435701 [Caerostris darwini]
MVNPECCQRILRYSTANPFIQSLGVRQSSPPSRTEPRAELQAIPKLCLRYAAHGFVFGGLECAGIIRVVTNELGRDISHDAYNCDITVFQSVCHLNNGVCEDGLERCSGFISKFRAQCQSRV